MPDVNLNVNLNGADAAKAALEGVSGAVESVAEASEKQAAAAQKVSDATEAMTESLGATAQAQEEVAEAANQAAEANSEAAQTQNDVAAAAASLTEKLNSLAQAQAENVEATRQHTEAQSSAEAEMSKTGLRMRGVQGIMSGLTHATQGGTAAITGLGRAALGMGQTFKLVSTTMLAWIGVVMAVVTAIVSLIARQIESAKAAEEQRKAIDASTTAHDAAADSAKAHRDALAPLAQVKLTQLSAEASALAQSYKEAADEAERLYQAKVALQGAKVQAKLAKLKMEEEEEVAAAPAEQRGIIRAKYGMKRAAITSKAEEEKVDEDIKHAEATKVAAEKTIQTAEEKETEIYGFRGEKRTVAETRNKVARKKDQNRVDTERVPVLQEESDLTSRLEKEIEQIEKTPAANTGGDGEFVRATRISHRRNQIEEITNFRKGINNEMKTASQGATAETLDKVETEDLDGVAEDLGDLAKSFQARAGEIKGDSDKDVREKKAYEAEAKGLLEFANAVKKEKDRRSTMKEFDKETESKVKEQQDAVDSAKKAIEDATDKMELLTVKKEELSASGKAMEISTKAGLAQESRNAQVKKLETERDALDKDDTVGRASKDEEIKTLKEAPLRPKSDKEVEEKVEMAQRQEAIFDTARQEEAAKKKQEEEDAAAEKEAEAQRVAMDRNIARESQIETATAATGTKAVGVLGGLGKDQAAAGGGTVSGGQLSSRAKQLITKAQSTAAGLTDGDQGGETEAMTSALSDLLNSMQGANMAEKKAVADLLQGFQQLKDAMDAQKKDWENMKARMSNGRNT